VSWRGRWLPA